MPDYRYTLTLTMQAPVLSQAAGSLGFGYDLAMLRDQDKAPVLPGSLVRGNLREALSRFVAALETNGAAPKAKEIDLDDWFGPRNGDDSAGNLTPARARFHFDYYWRCQAWDKAPLPRHRITLNPDTGTVQRRALVVIESTHPAGADMVFEGEMTAAFDNGKEAETARYWLDKAARFLPALGSLKGVGFGRVVKAEVAMKKVEPPPPKPYKGSTDRIGIALTLDRPFCVAAPRAPDSNLYSSEETLSGGVLKGALAWRLGPALPAALQFDRLAFTHAVPAEKKGKPRRERVLPLSLAWTGKSLTDDKPPRPIPENLVDLALAPVPEDDFFDRKPLRLGGAPKFQIDWKDEDRDAALKILGDHELHTLPRCSRHLEIRTEIEYGTGQSAENRLFSRDCIAPKGRVWCADIDLRAISDKEERRKAAEALLRELSRPLSGIGKTKAVATVAVRAGAFLAEPKLAPIEDLGVYVVTLQTPARLFGDADTLALPASGGEAALREVYANYWKTVSGDSLDLVRYFAGQRRLGGNFLWKRYLKAQDSPDKTYRPFWLTSAGSVFVLRAVKQDEASACLADWRRRGLPPPGGGESAARWNHDPYIRENGYGEIRVNDAVHTQYRIEPGEWS